MDILKIHFENTFWKFILKMNIFLNCEFWAVQKYVNLGRPLLESFPMSIYLQKIGVDTAEKRASQSVEVS